MTNIQKHFYLKHCYWESLEFMQWYIQENMFNQAIFHYLNSLLISDEIFENYDKLTKDQKHYIAWL